ncbi:MAG TPA: tetratricopeptide repeat protein [Thermoanaerobaculia bacterium]|nr:tetratricopeptide repeat protein [Thermoanaerobaculia bacterium]
MTPRTQPAGPTAQVIPNVPMQKWGIESCGAGSLSTVLQHYGDTTSMQEWDATLPKMRGGVLSIDMLLAARKRGFDAQLVTGTPESVEAELDAGRPVIMMLRVIDSVGKHLDFFHYVVVDGIDRERNLIRTQWGDRQGRWTTFAKLEKPWAGGGHAAILIHPRDELTEQLRAAVVLEEKGDYASAAKSYRDLLSRHPDSALLWTNLGNANVQLGRRGEAEDDFRKAIDSDPKSRDAMNNLAWLLYQQKRLDEAETFARKAASITGPDSYLVLDTLARVLAAKGDCSGAEAAFQQAAADPKAKLDPLNCR